MQVALLFGIVIAVTIAAIAIATWTARRRSRTLALTAAALGLSYRRDGAGLPNTDLLELPVFAFAAVAGQSTFSNVIEGPIAGTFVTACDYAYWTGSSNDQRFDYAQTVACFRLPPNRYPSLRIYPAPSGFRTASMAAARSSAEILAAIAKPLGFDDGRWAAVESALRAGREAQVDIEASPRFANVYRVVGPDPEQLKKLLNADALESLLNDEFFPLSVECSGVWLAVYRKNRRLPPRDLQKFLHRCVELHNTVFSPPSEVVHRESPR